MMRKMVGMLIFGVGAAILIAALLFMGGPDQACEQNPSVVLKGTFADCEARNPPAPVPSAQTENVLARR
jgi:hypothetical protein